MKKEICIIHIVLIFHYNRFIKTHAVSPAKRDRHPSLTKRGDGGELNLLKENHTMTLFKNTIANLILGRLKKKFQGKQKKRKLLKSISQKLNENKSFKKTTIFLTHYKKLIIYSLIIGFFTWVLYTWFGLLMALLITSGLKFCFCGIIKIFIVAFIQFCQQIAFFYFLTLWSVFNY